MLADEPYRPPEAPLERPPELETQPLRAFVGRKADYYLGKWQPLLEGESKLAGFNWAGAFFQEYWLFYRRLYGWGVAVILGSWALRYAVSAAAIRLAGPWAATVLELVFFVMLFVVFGLAANLLLYARALRIGEQTNPPMDAHQMRLRGGTKAAAVVLLVIVSLALPAPLGGGLFDD